MKTVSLPESKFRRSVDKAMDGTWMMTWHEDREITPGVPDLHFVMKGLPEEDFRVGWLELKALDTTICKSHHPRVEPSQHQYLRRWVRYMPIFFLVRVQERVYLIPGNMHDHVSAAVCRADLAVLAIAQFDEVDMGDILPPILRDLTRI